MKPGERITKATTAEPQEEPGEGRVEKKRGAETAAGKAAPNTAAGDKATGDKATTASSHCQFK